MSNLNGHSLVHEYKPQPGPVRMIVLEQRQEGKAAKGGFSKVALC